MVPPALNLYILDADILMIVQKVRLMMFSLNKVDYPLFFLLLSTWNCFVGQVDGTILRCSYPLSFFCGTPPPCLKIRRLVGGGGGGLQHFSVSPRQF